MGFRSISLTCGYVLPRVTCLKNVYCFRNIDGIENGNSLLGAEDPVKGQSAPLQMSIWIYIADALHDNESV